MLPKLLITIFLLVPVMIFGQDNTAKINRIEKKIKSFEKNLLTLEKFSESLFAEAKSKGLLIEDDLLLKLLDFDSKLLDLGFKISITKGVYKSLNGPVSKNYLDPLVELQLGLLSTNNKPPTEFIKDMLLIIEDRINSLKKERDLIKKFVVSKITK